MLSAINAIMGSGWFFEYVVLKELLNERLKFCFIFDCGRCCSCDFVKSAGRCF